MKKIGFLKGFLIGLSVAITVSAIAAGVRYIQADQLNLGTPGSSADKVIDFDGTRQIKANQTSGTLQFSNDGATFIDIGSGSGGGAGGISLLDNTGFEDGVDNWTGTTAAPTQETNAAGVGIGEGSLAWTPDSAADFLDSDQVTVPNALHNKVCDLDMQYRGLAANHKVVIYDGTSTIEEFDLIDTGNSGADWQNDFFIFTCPSSGTFGVRIDAGDTNTIRLDEVLLGQSAKIRYSNAAQFYGAIKYPGVASCEWLSTSLTYVDFATDSDCVGATTEGNASDAGDDLPSIQFNNQEPGDYLFVWSGAFSNGAAQHSCLWQMTDGTQTVRLGRQTHNTNGGIVPVLTGRVPVSSTATRTWKLQARSVAGPNSCAVVNSNTDMDFNVSVYQYPSDLTVSRVVEPQETDWFVAARIGGTNISLGTADVATYTEITNSSLDAVLLGNSQAAEIACSGTNPSTGLTCAAGNESLGLAFDIPFPGRYKVCTNLHYRSTAAGDQDGAKVAFQHFETPNNAQTELQAGGNAATTESQNPVNGTQNFIFSDNIRVCSEFDFASAGQKTIRLKYEQDVSTISASEIIAERAVAVGERDTYWTVEPLSRKRAAVKIDVGNGITSTQGTHNLDGFAIDSGDTTGLNKTCWWRSTVECTSGPTCAIAAQSGCVSSIDRNAQGDRTVNFSGGYWSEAPSCFAWVGQSTFTAWGDTGDQLPSASEFGFNIRSDSGTTIDKAHTGFCIGR